MLVEMNTTKIYLGLLSGELVESEYPKDIDQEKFDVVPYKVIKLFKRKLQYLLV